MKTETNHAIENGRGHLENIVDLFRQYQNADSHDMQENIQERCHEIPLSIDWRSSGWCPVGENTCEPDEGQILLTTGGPALRILVDLSQGYACDPALQWQDWGTPYYTLSIGKENWCDIKMEAEESEEALAWFVSMFWWGE